MKPLEVISPLEIRIRLFHRLQQAPRKGRATADTDDDGPTLVSGSDKHVLRKE